MSDDERIKRIDLLYADMQDKYVFANSFSNDINLMALQRTKELQEASLRCASCTGIDHFSVNQF